MKVAINACFGGFSLSPQAIQHLASKQGRSCTFFLGGLREPYREATVEEASGDLFFTATDGWIPKRHANEEWDAHVLDVRPKQRNDPHLIQTIEELGDAASGRCAKIKIVEVPDDVDWIIQEYDGNEWVAEKHRTWE